jgi:hypothetical protein
MDIGYYKNLRRKNSFLGADDDFVGPPAPEKKSNENLKAVFGGLSTIAKTVSDSIVQGQLTVKKNGISYNGVSTTIPGIQTNPPVVSKTDYTKYLWVMIPALAGIYLITKHR